MDGILYLEDEYDKVCCKQLQARMVSSKGRGGVVSSKEGGGGEGINQSQLLFVWGIGMLVISI